MPTTSITAAYVNEPKGKGPGNIKTPDGQYYKVWKTSKVPGFATLGQFEPGKTYDIEYDEEEPYNGKPQYMITKLVSASTTQSTNGANGHDASARYRNSDTKSEEIKWMAAQKVAALLFVGTRDVDGCLMAARFIFREPVDVVEEAKKLFSATEAKE